MSDLVDYARRELQLAGESRRVCAAVEAAVSFLARHGGGPKETVRLADLVVQLVSRRPLSAISRDPADWQDMSAVAGVRLWQSTRDPRVFSTDAGATYTFEDDAGQQVYRSAMPITWVRALCEQHGLTRGDAVAAVEAYFQAGPITDRDVWVMDQFSTAERRLYIVRRWPGSGMLVAALLYDPPDDDEPDQADDPARVTGIAA